MFFFPGRALTIFLVLFDVVYSSTVLFPEAGEYVYSFRAKVSTGSVLPKHLSSTHGLKFSFKIQHEDAESNKYFFMLHEQQHTIYNTESAQDAEGIFKTTSSEVSDELTRPFIATYRNDGTIEYLNFTEGEPLWSMNMKRAIAASLQMQSVGRPLPGAFKLNEPCLHGMCVVEYSSSDGKEIRKSNNVPTLQPTPTHDLWMSVMPNICTKDTKNPLIGDVDRWYTMDDNGLVKMVSKGNVQVHYHNHIFQSITHIELERTRVSKSYTNIEFVYPIQTDVSYQPPDRHEPTGGRSPQNPSSQLEQLWNTLGRIADGLEQAGLTKTFLRDKLPLRLQDIIATLSYDTLKKAHEELELGTSYKWETMKNIFMEVLPQAKSKSSVLLIRDLIVEKKIGDDSTVLQLLRKMPFNVADLSQNLLVELEPLLKLNQDHSRDVRHAAILSFSTLVFKTFIAGACTSDAFEDYVQTYFSRFTESPDYVDRLVWLSGLSNLQLEHVTTYLAPVISGTLGHSSNERFLAVWATMPIAHLYSTEVHNTYWPILHNSAEPLEMRVAAIIMLILAEPTSHRLLSLHWYIVSQDNLHLSNFFYTTIKSLEQTTFDCYKHLAKLASYLGKTIKRPRDQTQLWGTGNYLLDIADTSRDMGIMLQTLFIANQQTGIPEILYFTLLTHNAGLVVQDYAIYLKLQGVVSNFLGKLRSMNADSVKIPDLVDALRRLKIQPHPVQPIHVEILIKYQGKVIYGSHINQTTFNKWTEGDLKKTIDNILQAESHINQQLLVYPTILKSTLPSELGIPIITDTILSSLTSIRGNLTFFVKDDELARRNDVHLRTSTLALISLASYNPIADTHHLAEVAQVSDAYFPANFTIAVSINKQTLRTTWLNPGSEQSPRFVGNSGARVAMAFNKDINLSDFCPSCQGEMMTSGDILIMSSFSGMDLECTDPATLSELVWQIITSHKSNANVLPLAKPWLVLLHGLILGAIPARGPCQLAITSSNYVKFPQRTDTEIELLSNMDEPDRHLFKVSFYRTDEKTNKILSILNTTTSVQFIDGIKVSFKAVDAEHQKICLEAEEKYVKDTELQELKTEDNLIATNLVVAFGKSENKCPTDGTLVKLNLKPDYTNKSVESYNIQLEVKNVPEFTRSMFNKYSNVIEIIGANPTIFSLDMLKLLARELSQIDAAINASVIVAGDNARIQFNTENDTATDHWNIDDNLRFLNPKGHRQFFKDIGFTKECSVKQENLLDVNKKMVDLKSAKDCEVLAIADCTNSPKFAVVKLPSPNGLALKFYTGGNFVEIHPTEAGDLKVTVNDQQVVWQPSYKFPKNEKFYDFIISGSGNKLKIESQITSVTLKYRTKEAIISFPTTHLSLSCGACIAAETLFTKC